ncbi:MAG TPA: hypothetical protein VN622_12745 [Clostridia bacterium]|nr:hypothetical protein [Clostridia bacterium]
MLRLGPVVQKGFGCRASFILLATFAMLGLGHAQSLSATGSTALKLRVLGSIQVNVRTIPLSFLSIEDQVSLPLETAWNVNPSEVRNIQVIAYFDDSNAALVSADGSTAIPSRDVLGSVNGGTHRSFTETNLAGPGGASLRVSETSIDATNRHSSRKDLIQLRLNSDALLHLPEVPYSGTLHIEVKHY